MSKERLEEIKNSHLRGIHSLFGTPWVSMPKENFEWLIEQAEQVEELEDHKSILQLNLNLVLKEKQRLEQQNKRYREALEFYADKGTYEVAETLPPTDEYQQPIEPVFKTVPIIYYDKGNTARKALEGEE